MRCSFLQILAAAILRGPSRKSLIAVLHQRVWKQSLCFVLWDQPLQPSATGVPVEWLHRSPIVRNPSSGAIRVISSA